MELICIRVSDVPFAVLSHAKLEAEYIVYYIDRKAVIKTNNLKDIPYALSNRSVVFTTVKNVDVDPALIQAIPPTIDPDCNIYPANLSRWIDNTPGVDVWIRLVPCKPLTSLTAIRDIVSRLSSDKLDNLKDLIKQAIKTTVPSNLLEFVKYVYTEMPYIDSFPIGKFTDEDLQKYNNKLSDFRISYHIRTRSTRKEIKIIRQIESLQPLPKRVFVPASFNKIHEKIKTKCPSAVYVTSGEEVVGVTVLSSELQSSDITYNILDYLA